MFSLGGAWTQMTRASGCRPAWLRGLLRPGSGASWASAWGPVLLGYLLALLTSQFSLCMCEAHTEADVFAYVHVRHRNPQVCLRGHHWDQSGPRGQGA